MKVARPLLLVVFSLAITTTAAFAQQTYQFRANGDALQADAGVTSGNGGIFISARRGSDSFNQPATVISYSFSTFDGTNTIIITGTGTAPLSALTGSAATGMNLSVDTNSSSFVNRRCTFDPNTGETACVDTTGGPISASCTRNKLFDVQRSGTTQSVFAQTLTFIENGSSVSGSADCDLNVLGNTGHTQFGALVTFSSVTLQVQQK